MNCLLAAALRGPQLTGLIIRRSATACVHPPPLQFWKEAWQLSSDAILQTHTGSLLQLSRALPCSSVGSSSSSSSNRWATSQGTQQAAKCRSRSGHPLLATWAQQQQHC